MPDLKPTPETPPLTRAGRKAADATLASAHFKPTSDGKSAIRHFEVHGMAVTEMVHTRDAIPTAGEPAKEEAPHVRIGHPAPKCTSPETPPLSRLGRKVADTTLAAAKFKPTRDGKRMARQFEVHGMAVTEFVSADRPQDGDKE